MNEAIAVPVWTQASFSGTFTGEAMAKLAVSQILDARPNAARNSAFGTIVAVRGEAMFYTGATR
jgi:hypothetical protein